AVSNRDPYTGAQVMARGIVGTRDDAPTVASPLHKQVFDLRTGLCLDTRGGEPAALRVWPVLEHDGELLLDLAEARAEAAGRFCWASRSPGAMCCSSGEGRSRHGGCAGSSTRVPWCVWSPRSCIRRRHVWCTSTVRPGIRVASALAIST